MGGITSHRQPRSLNWSLTFLRSIAGLPGKSRYIGAREYRGNNAKRWIHHSTNQEQVTWQVNKALKSRSSKSIRGIAALLVVLFHMPFWNSTIYDTHIIRNSYYMVDLFFVLSGFVMFLNYGERLRSAKDLARFQLLRIGRLYPVHLLFLLIALLAAVGKWFAARDMA